MKFNLYELLLNLLSRLVPKDSRLIVYLPGKQKGAVGNLDALYSHAVGRSSAFRHVWLGARQASVARSRHSELISLLVLHWRLLRARIVVVDSAKGYLARGRFEFVQLWHGAGYKNIALRSGKDPPHLREFYSKCILVTATSDADRRRKVECFGNPRVCITGNPRNDLLFRRESGRSILDEDARIVGDRVVLYAPTYRDAPGVRPFSDADWEALDDLMDRRGWTLIVKLHPAEKTLNVPSNYARVIPIDVSVDIQNLLVFTDVLVTDYSSVATDFALLERPIIFYFYDFDSYVRDSRTFYFDPHTIVPGPIVRSCDELIAKLSDLDWAQTPDYRRRYREFAQFFHEYRDGKSSERVHDRILAEIASGDSPGGHLE